MAVPVIAILGGGFAGISVAQRLERLLRPQEARVVLLSRENFSLFTPMLPEVTSGELEVRHVVTPIRAQLRRTSFILSDVSHVDPRHKRLEYRHVLSGQSDTLEYDHLVLALGSTTSTFGLPGVADRVFALKSLEDAERLRNRLIWLLELADTVRDEAYRDRLLTIAVVGGGFTGVEAAGEIEELFRSVLRYYPNVRAHGVKIVLVEAGPSLLAGLPPKMGEYSRRVLERRGIEVLTGDGVALADDGGLQLQSGRRIETA
ncbi:MAG TPA: FAD-dependent oxidoreductase, partial [Verrucomicrobiae bacterium]|nr:FAD-dependent oxidoreductase [Verrucomicrobiae bacterium]